MELIQKNTALPVYGCPAYSSEIKKFNKWLQGRPIASLTILEYFQQLKVSPASKSVAKYAIKRVLKAGLLGGNQLIDAVQMETVFKQIKTAQTKRKVEIADLVTDQEMKQIRAEASARVSMLCEFLFPTGLRIAELSGIELKNCSGRENIIHIRVLGKGSKIRTVMVSSDLFLQVRALFPNTKYLFGKPNNEKFTVRYLRKLITSAGKIIGRKFWPHLLRHSFATQTLQRTNKIKAVSEYLGHSSPSITLSMYIHQELDVNDLMLGAV